MTGSLFTFDPISFRVYGEPLPFPKKEIGMRRKRVNGKIETRPFILAHDEKRHKDPITGELIVVSRGDKARWVALVKETALKWMEERDRKPFPRHYPIAMGCLFFLTRAKSCKLEQPSIDPDLDNLEYSIWNALKRSPTTRRRGVAIPGRYPDGICFYDDGQIVSRLGPQGKRWADKDNPPGVLISIADADNNKAG
jgi:hypothetical protein